MTIEVITRHNYWAAYRLTRRLCRGDPNLPGPGYHYGTISWQRFMNKLSDLDNWGNGWMSQGVGHRGILLVNCSTHDIWCPEPRAFEVLLRSQPGKGVARALRVHAMEYLRARGIVHYHAANLMAATPHLDEEKIADSMREDGFEQYTTWWTKIL